MSFNANRCIFATSGIILVQHGTIEEIIKHIDLSKYPLPDDWLEPSERAEKRARARQEVKARKEAREKELNEKATEGNKVTEKKNDVDETKDSTDTASPSKRVREEDKDDCVDEADDTPPMYRQARALFLNPEVGMA